MKKLFFIVLILLFTSSISSAKNIKEAYFAGGCFWCMEEFFEKVDGVEEVISEKQKSTEDVNPDLDIDYINITDEGRIKKSIEGKVLDKLNMHKYFAPYNASISSIWSKIPKLL